MEISAGQNNLQNQQTVSFIIPTFNAGSYLESCLRSIRSQDYPQNRIEIIIADRGSTDRTVDLAKAYKCCVLHDMEELPEPRAANCQKKANGEIIVFLSADNELTREDWLTRMVLPFENEIVYGVFTPNIDSPQDKPFTKYFNLLQRDPFSWYLIGKVNPNNSRKKFPVLKETEDYIVFDYTTEKYDLIAYHQGFVVRNDFKRSQETEFDDILPVLEIIEKGYKIAFEKNVGIHHHTLESFYHFAMKFHRRIRERIINSNYGYKTRVQYMSREMKARQYLWFIYSLTLVGPIVDMIKGSLRDRSIWWIYHPPACFTISCSVLLNYFCITFNRIFRNNNKLIDSNID